MKEQLLAEMDCITGESDTYVALKQYLTGLIEKGRKLPKSRGDINRSRIADACNFDRQSLYPSRGSKSTIQLLKWAQERIGVEENESSLDQDLEVEINVSDKALNKLLTDSKKKDERISKLESDLLQSTQTIAELQDKVSELNRIIKQSALVMDASVSGDDIVLP